MSKIEVKAIPSSFVAKNMKLYSDTGAGEAKLFVGSTRNTKEFNEFFEFESDYKYRFSKENLLQYLNQTKLEYGFQKINRYKNVSLETWEENYRNISSMDEDEFYFELHSFADKSRFYIRSDDELFKKTFRNLVVPKLTNAIFSKDEVARIITVKLEINFNADTLTDVSKTVSVEGIPALSIEDLGRILKDMYNNAKESGQVAAIHMFGFKYGDIITTNGYSQKTIISLAGINDSYSEELNKGVNIYKSVKANEYGVSFNGNPIEDEDMLSCNVKDNTADDQDSTVQTTCDRQPRSNKVNPLNLIIYGAPGTGKTYSTAEYAVATIEGRQVRKDLSTGDRKTLMDQYRALAKAGKIVFTTFHQNYG